jgi:hypothetical protein
MLELYHNINSVCAQKVRIALHEKRRNAKEHLLKLQGDQNDPAYLHLLARFKSVFPAAIIQSSSAKLRPAPAGPAVPSCTSVVNSAVSTTPTNASRSMLLPNYE